MTKEERGWGKEEWKAEKRKFLSAPIDGEKTRPSEGEERYLLLQRIEGRRGSKRDSRSTWRNIYMRHAAKVLSLEGENS